MLRIKCPYCGVRDLDEFHFGGEANIVRPADPETASDAEWSDYLFYRDNIKGRHLERWHHSFGCGQWFLAVRDTLTHAFEGSWKLQDAGDIPSGAGDDG